MTEQVKRTGKDIGTIKEAYYSALGYTKQTGMKVIELRERGNDNEFSPREKELIEAAKADGFANGVAAGLQFVLTDNSRVNKIISEQNDLLDKGEI